jgi:hypothetical protein
MDRTASSFTCLVLRYPMRGERLIGDGSVLGAEEAPGGLDER